MFSIPLILIRFEDITGKQVSNVNGKAFACRRLKEIVRLPLQSNRRLFWCLLSLESNNGAIVTVQVSYSACGEREGGGGVSGEYKPPGLACPTPRQGDCVPLHPLLKSYKQVP